MKNSKGKPVPKGQSKMTNFFQKTPDKNQEPSSVKLNSSFDSSTLLTDNSNSFVASDFSFSASSSSFSLLNSSFGSSVSDSNNNEYQESANAILGVVEKENDMRKSGRNYPIVQTKVKDNNFKYGSKKPEKEVLKPYSKIHEYLMDVNLDRDDKDGNYLVAHILFVVSNEPYNGNRELKEVHQGTRTYIDFPINIKWKAEHDSLYFNDKSAQKGRGENQYGQYSINEKDRQSAHSERALMTVFKNPDFIKQLVGILKNKLSNKDNKDSSEIKSDFTEEKDNKNYKVYEVNLFIDSTLSVCGSCEPVLDELQSSTEEGSFLDLLRFELNEAGFITPKIKEGEKLKDESKSLSGNGNHNDKGFPKMMISIKYKKECEAPRKSLNDKPWGFIQTKERPIDTKLLSGKVILSDERKANQESTDNKIPFNTLFTSAGAKYGYDTKEAQYQDPKSFDGISNFPKTIPDTSPSKRTKKAEAEHSTSQLVSSSTSQSKSQ